MDKNIRMKKIQTILVVTIAAAALLTSCFKEDVVLKDPQKYTRPVNFAGPIANIHFGAKDLLERVDTSSFFQIDEDGLLHFRYDTALSAIIEDLVKFDNLELNVNYDLNQNRKATTLTFRDSIVTNEDPNQRFDSLIMTEGMIKITINSPAGFTGTYIIDIPEIILSNGQPLSINGNLNSGEQVAADLAGAKMFFQNKNGKSFCEIITTITADVTGIPTSSMLGMNIVLEPFIPDYIFGYFGEVEVLNEDSEVALDFFENLNISDVIQFKDIRLDLFVKNYMGAPLQIVFDTLQFTNETSGEEVNVLFNDGSNNMLVNPAEYENSMIVPSENTLSFNAENSNLIDGINIGPTKIHASVVGELNPNGGTQENFLHTDLELEGSISIDIPLWFKTSLYERTDTIAFNLLSRLDSAQIDYLDELNLYFDFTNGFPFNIVAQGYFADSTGNVIDSIWSEPDGVMLWKSGNVDDVTGKVTSASITNVTIQILNEKARKLFENEAAFIYLKSNISTGDIISPEFVKLYDSYTIDIGLSGELKSGELNF
jgi:hypothetical protein